MSREGEDMEYDDDAPEWLDRFIRGVIRQQVRQEVRPAVDTYLANQLDARVEERVDAFVEKKAEDRLDKAAREAGVEAAERVVENHSVDIVTEAAQTLSEGESNDLRTYIELQVQNIVDDVLRKAIPKYLDELTDIDGFLQRRARAALAEEARRLSEFDKSNSESETSPALPAEQVTFAAFTIDDDHGESVQEEMDQAVATAGDEGPFIRYVSPEGNLIGQEPVESTDEMPQLGDLIELQGVEYTVTLERRAFEPETDELAYYWFEVEPSED